MNKLILHPDTKKRIDALMKHTPQSLLLHGERGVGLLTIAKKIAGAAAIVVTPEVESQTDSIKTDRIRRLYEETKGAAAKQQFVIIDDADTMTHAAQSAFLKLLEEPNHTTHFILTTHDKDKLLPTIVSRVQAHHLVLPSERATKAHTTSVIADPMMRRQVAFLAPRQPSLIHAYLTHPEQFTRDAELMSAARKCITATSTYDRQVIALTHATSRSDALRFIDACIHLLRYSLVQDTTAASIVTIDTYITARDALVKNVNVKLALAKLMIQ